MVQPMNNNMNLVNVEELLNNYRDVIYTSLLIRRSEEKMLQLFSEGKINGTVHTCIGQELIGACLVKNLHKDDFIVSNHRGHGHYIARTGDIKGLFAEVMGRITGVCKGMGGSQHLLAHHYISNGIQGGMTPIAAGIAMAYKIKNNKNIAIAFIGDGTLGEGILYETLNICGLWSLPILFILENNSYAQSTSMKQSFSGNVRKRVEGFGIKYLGTDTWNMDSLTSKMSSAVNIVRNNQTPCFLEIETYRLKPHSKGDDNRDKEEILWYSKKDILTQIVASNSKDVTTCLSDINKRIDYAVEFASNSPIFDTCKNASNTSVGVSYENFSFPEINKRINELIYDSFRDLFSKDGNLIMIGEDIEYQNQFTTNSYGGAFKVTKNLSKLFKERIKNTPISEAAIVGIGTGLALAGMKPIVEIMFGDFITLAFDQIINHATKFCSMFGQELDIPLVIRTPMGGRRGYGPTHSQSLEKYLLGIPNLSIIALNYRINPADIYHTIYMESSNPTFVIENKVLYTRKLNNNEMLGFSIQCTNEAYPTLRIRSNYEMLSDITVFCYGGMLEEVENAVKFAFEEEEIICEIICPTLINPLNIEPIISSISETQKLLIIEEGNNIAALGSEISAKIAERGITLKKFKRIGVNVIIPCSFAAENNLLPNKNSIFLKIKEMHNECKDNSNCH